MQTLKNGNESYFIAANSYYGFKSFFNTELDPLKYEKIFVLKGGPGTGKSTLMKEIVEFSIQKGYQAKSIFCSSDTNSLDGAIISSNEKKIAIVDGTSPHALDTTYPVCIEEIINLAQGLNSDKLEGARKSIVYHSKLKSESYKKAYLFLKIAGFIDKYIYDEYAKMGINNKAEKMILEICSQIEVGTGEFKKHYIRSFGKNGLSLCNGIKVLENTISIKGNEFARNILLTKISEHLINENKATVICPSPLADYKTDAVYTHNFLIHSSTIPTESVKINADEFFDGQICCDDMIEIRNEMERIATRYFSAAAQEHFALEKIYTESLDFTYNDRIISNLKAKISNMLD